ncbi:MAG: MFS transporter, partial [Actinomycetota bacterium]
LYLFTFAAVWLSFGAFAALEPLFYRDVLEVGPETLGWVNALFGIGILGGSVLLGRLPRRIVCARTAAVGAMGSGLGAVAYAGTDVLATVVVGAVCWGVVLGVLFPLLRTLIQLDTPDHLTGRVLGATNVTGQLGELLPLTFVPALAAASGVQTVLVGSGACLLAVAALGLREAGRVDRLRKRLPEVLARLEVSDEPVTPNR